MSHHLRHILTPCFLQQQLSEYHQAENTSPKCWNILQYMYRLNQSAQHRATDYTLAVCLLNINYYHLIWVLRFLFKGTARLHASALIIWNGTIEVWFTNNTWKTKCCCQADGFCSNQLFIGCFQRLQVQLLLLNKCQHVPYLLYFSYTNMKPLPLFDLVPVMDFINPSWYCPHLSKTILTGSSVYACVVTRSSFPAGGRIDLDFELNRRVFL